MENHVIEQVSASSYPFWLQMLLIAVIMGVINSLTIYFKEKGKNFATKEDIGEITQKIESIKNIHSVSLESFKNNLQKEFESYKYIEGLCQRIDKQLLRLLIRCKYEHDNLRGIENLFYYRLDSFSSLAKYLRRYDFRYSHIDEVRAIIRIYDEIEQSFNNYEIDEYGQKLYIYDEFFMMKKTEESILIIDSLLAKFLPPLNLFTTN